MSEFLDRPTEHVDVSGNPDAEALVESFGRASFQARNLYGCSEVYRRMARDEETVIFLGLAGAMVPAGMKKIISDLMKNHLIDVLVSTGANLFHDFFEALGYHHYVGDAEAPDDESDLRYVCERP
jgi:deoxyhypusine synthase